MLTTAHLTKVKHLSLLLRWSLLEFARKDLAATPPPLSSLTRGVMDTAARQVENLRHKPAGHLLSSSLEFISELIGEKTYDYGQYLQN